MGTNASDILVGDKGGASLENVDTNILMILDTSGSMSAKISFNGQEISRTEALKLAVGSFLQDLGNSEAQNVRVHLVEFNSNSRTIGTFDLITDGAAQVNELQNA